LSIIAYFLKGLVKRPGRHPDTLLGHYSMGPHVDFWGLSITYIHSAAGYTQ